MKVQITPQDIVGAERNGMDNPIARAIRRVAGGHWYVYGPFAYETTAPYRAVALPFNAAISWKRFVDTGCIDPLGFDLCL